LTVLNDLEVACPEKFQKIVVNGKDMQLAANTHVDVKHPLV